MRMRGSSYSFYLSNVLLGGHQTVLKQTLQHLWMWARYENGCPKFGGSSPITWEPILPIFEWFRLLRELSSCHVLGSEPCL